MDIAPKWGKMVDHFTPFWEVVVKFGAKIVKFPNNLESKQPH